MFQVHRLPCTVQMNVQFAGFVQIGVRYLIGFLKTFGVNGIALLFGVNVQQMFLSSRLLRDDFISTLHAGYC